MRNITEREGMMDGHVILEAVSRTLPTIGFLCNVNAATENPPTTEDCLCICRNDPALSLPTSFMGQQHGLSLYLQKQGSRTGTRLQDPQFNCLWRVASAGQWRESLRSCG
jgi:hypothetical protein